MFMLTKASDERIPFSTGARAAGICLMLRFPCSPTLLSTHCTINTLLCVCVYGKWAYLFQRLFLSDAETPEPNNQTVLHQGLCNVGKCVFVWHVVCVCMCMLPSDLAGAAEIILATFKRLCWFDRVHIETIVKN